MSDLIERQAAERRIDEALSRVFVKTSDSIGKQILDRIPSTQPEIVRCKDCKYWREHKYAKETKRYIPFCGFNAIYTESDDFCSRAERRTDE